MKKIIFVSSILAVGAMVFTVAAPASAGFWRMTGITVNNNSTVDDLDNIVTVNANTGDNEIEHVKKVKNDIEIETGDATALADVMNGLNQNTVDIKTKCDTCQGNIKVENLGVADVFNKITVNANTGDNEIKHVKFVKGEVEIDTGDAIAAATLTNVINLNEVTITRGLTHHGR